jgi:CHAT domain-containing protein
VDTADEAVGRAAVDLRLQWILTAYIKLLADVKGTTLESRAGIDAVAEAFRLADVARGRMVQRALDEGAARAAARDPGLADLIRQQQDVTKQISALYGHLAKQLSQPAEAQGPNSVTMLRLELAKLEPARRALAAQIAKDFPGYAQLTNPPPATVESVRASLQPSEAIVSIYVTRDRTFVWAISAEGVVAFAALPVAEQGLAAQVAELRRALEPNATTVDEIPAFDVARAHELYRLLLEPVRDGWERAQSLFVVANGPLAELPFALLVTRPASLEPESGPLFSRYRRIPWLVRTHAVTILPSITSLGTLRHMPPVEPGRLPFIGFGDPLFSEEQARRVARRAKAPGTASERPPVTIRGADIMLRSTPKLEGVDSSQLAMLPPLPDTAEEIRSIALTLDADLTRDVFLGESANEQAVRTANLWRYRVIAFATHGLRPGDLDGLTQPALALTAPEVAHVEGDGLLTVEKILGLRLNADWVVLSACNTAKGNGAGSEAISGLGRAFFYAGARALLVSNWPVETTSARVLTTDLFRRQRQDPTLDRARALQQTMNALIDSGEFRNPPSRKVIFSYAHPIFWAPFTLVGDGGGAE